MKNAQINLRATLPRASMDTPRFQIFRQTPAGNYTPGSSTNSAVEAVEMFIKQTPWAVGGEMHLWNHRERCICASVRWVESHTDLGFPVLMRANAFFDGLMSVIVRQYHENEAARESIRQDSRIGV